MMGESIRQIWVNLQLHRVTWWTRHDKDEPQLTDDEEEFDKQIKAFEKDRDGIGEMEIDDGEIARKENTCKSGE